MVVVVVGVTFMAVLVAVIIAMANSRRLAVQMATSGKDG
jgi:hypothetical protein